MDHYGLLELGSNSLKFHLVTKAIDDRHVIKTHKLPWRVAHDFFSAGRIEETTADELIDSIRRAGSLVRGVSPESILAVATGVFRELDSMGSVIDKVRAETGVRVRVISGDEEAQLMARGFRKLKFEPPALFCDLGGATTEWVYLGKEEERWGSLPLGAIRNEYLFGSLKSSPQEYLEKSSEYCDRQLEAIPFEGETKVVCTGGTAKALARNMDRRLISVDDLTSLIDRVLREGPPDGLKPQRRDIFLPGLVVLWRVLVKSESTTLCHSSSAVRQGMVLRLIRLLDHYPRQDLHATLLLRDTNLRKKWGRSGKR